MLAQTLLATTYPALFSGQLVADALMMAKDAGYPQLPVLDGQQFLGFALLNDLEEVAAEDTVGTLTLIKAQVQGQAHLLQALHTTALLENNFIAVLDMDGQYLGTLGPEELFTATSRLLNAGESGGIIVLEMDRRQYSFGELSRLVETNESYITQLNTYTEPGTGLWIVTIRINRAELSDVVSTLQRYEYSIRYYFGEESYQNELRENYSALMNYLNL